MIKKATNKLPLAAATFFSNQDLTSKMDFYLLDVVWQACFLSGLS
jgi:hypothetical protein